MTDLIKTTLTLVKTAALCLCLCAGAAASWDGTAAWDQDQPWDQDLSRPAAQQEVEPPEPNYRTDPLPLPDTDGSKLYTLGETLCEAGVNADIDAIFELMDPNSIEIILEMYTDVGEDEPGMDRIQAMKAEIRAELRDNPLTACIVEGVHFGECDDEPFSEYSGMGDDLPRPQHCASITLRYMEADDEETNAEDIPAIKLGGRWYLVML